MDRVGVRAVASPSHGGRACLPFHWWLNPLWWLSSEPDVRRLQFVRAQCIDDHTSFEDVDSNDECMAAPRLPWSRSWSYELRQVRIERPAQGDAFHVKLRAVEKEISSLLKISHPMFSESFGHKPKSSHRFREGFEGGAYFSDGVPCDSRLCEWFPRFVDRLRMTKVRKLAVIFEIGNGCRGDERIILWCQQQCRA